MGDIMEKMIVGGIMALLGGAGCIFTLWDMVAVVTSRTGMETFGAMVNSTVIVDGILFIISGIVFGVGVIFIQQDRDEGRRYYDFERRY